MTGRGDWGPESVNTADLDEWSNFTELGADVNADVDAGSDWSEGCAVTVTIGGVRLDETMGFWDVLDL